MDIFPKPKDFVPPSASPSQPVTLDQTREKTSAVIKFIRIFLLALIVIGVSLSVSQRYWVPPLVNFILGSQAELNTQSVTVASTSVDVQVTEPNEFVTYKNTELGFSIVYPKTAYKYATGCTFNEARQSYEFTRSTSTEDGQVPLQTFVQGKTVYLDFAYFYDLIQKESGSPIYSQCLKQAMPEYLVRYLNKTPYPNDFIDDEPISVTIEVVSSTQVAKAIALALVKSSSGGYCNEVVMTPATQSGVFDLKPVLPAKDNSQTDEIPPSCDYVPHIKYSPTEARVAIIKNGPHQYCPFSHDGSPNSFFDSACYNKQIETSFLFLR
jgi:hypothetical protein